jgi:putative membrane protein
MMKRLLINALALAVATFLLDGRGITLDSGDWLRTVLTIICVAIIFGIVNAVIKPIFKVLTGCLIMITFGLFLLVINGALLMLTSWACGQLDLGWHVDHFWPTAVIASVIISVVNFLVSKFLKETARHS